MRPADVRAVLQPEAALLNARAKLPCTDAATATDAREALEIGKFAWRAAEYPRGYCWIKRSADFGNVRAKVLLGMAAGMGWGVPQDRNAAFKFFHAQAESTDDVWTAYFTRECYLAGRGTPVDRSTAAYMDTWLMFRPDGQALFLSIGDDDANIHRAYERSMLFLNPPITEQRVCNFTAQGPGKPPNRYVIPKKRSMSRAFNTSFTRWTVNTESNFCPLVVCFG
jgi:hypothetical protein